MKTAYLALGSNLGDRLGQMREALTVLASEYGVQILRASPVYENRAIGMGAAADFLNAVVEIETDLVPEALLDACLEVEARLGRVRAQDLAPRTIDLDVLTYGNLKMSAEHLHLPHPRLIERDFVAKPLMDLAPDLEIRGKGIREWVAALPELDLNLFPTSLLPER